MRLSSGTCMKRFSKMVSTTRLSPSATAFIAINCACMSVGKPGCSVVRMFTAFGRCCMSMEIQSSPASMMAPASTSLSKTTSMVLGAALRRTTLPPVMATAQRKVPASMRSGTTLCSQPCSSFTPSTVMVDVPMPLIFAPILTRHSAKSTTSGSMAQFSRMVVPSARVAAISRFSVPPTVIISITTRVPFRRPLALT